MGKFLETEKIKQIQFKTTSPSFTEITRQDGMYKRKPRAYCIPVANAEQNLFPEIRDSALDFFSHHKIKWHDGQNGKPSNHLCDSQVCCVNFLFPFADKPGSLERLFKPHFPLLGRMLPVESGKYVSFEWIGQTNYLGEKIPHNGQRTRGANFTSADSIVMFERKDKKRQIVLIEWKYTESYGGAFLKYSPSGTDRTRIYRPLFEQADCPLDKTILPNFDSLFYEPFYQLMRQQLLANEMEKAHEQDADIVSLLHIAPAHNTDFRKVTSPELVDLGESATGVWKRLVKNEGKFTSLNTEKIFGCLSVNEFPELETWLKYIQQRYPWVGEKL